MQSIAAYYVLVASDLERQVRQQHRDQVVVTRPRLPARIASAVASFVRSTARSAAQTA
jgi:hypothetical protein